MEREAQAPSYPRFLGSEAEALRMLSEKLRGRPVHLVPRTGERAFPAPLLALFQTCLFLLGSVVLQAVSQESGALERAHGVRD